MFRRLLSNLPFNPSLIGQIGFYAKRLKQESAVRRMGVLFLVLSIGVQIFATAVPSQPTLARSGNDILPGGFSSQSQAVNQCKSNAYNFKKILENFGIDCLALYYGSVKTISSRDYGGQLYSMGRAPYGKPGEVTVSIPGVGNFYMRPLKSWDTGGPSNYKAIVGNRSNGQPFMVLFNCGNVTIVGAPTPPSPPPPPPPKPTKVIQCSNLLMSLENKSEVSIGTPVSFTGQATGKNVNKATEKVKMHYKMIDKKTGKLVDSTLANGVIFKRGVATDPQPRQFKIDKEGVYIFKLKVTYSKNGSTETASGSESGECVKKLTVKKDIPCKDATDGDVTVCLILNKRAQNDSQNTADADGKVAKAGNLITYVLSVKNSSSNTKVKGFSVEENITDILEYADVENLHGGIKDDQNIVQWPAKSIEPGKTIEQKLTVQIKDPIPQTPISASNPGSFDCTITNVYGETVNIKLGCSVPKTTEQIVGSLPNTGPGETIAVAFLVTSVAGYFFARSRLMARELQIVRNDYAISGGN